MLKRKKHQQWSWTDKTDSSVQRYIKWGSKPHIQKRIFKEHIEIPLRNIIVDIIIKQNVGDNAYLKSKYIIDRCSKVFESEVIPKLSDENIKNYFGLTHKHIKNFLRKEIKKIWTSKTDSAIERWTKSENKPRLQDKIYKEHIETPLRVLSRRNIKTNIYKRKGEKLFQYDPNKQSSYEEEIDNLVDDCVGFFFTTCYPYIKNGRIETTIFGYVNTAVRRYLIDLNTERTDGVFEFNPHYGIGKDDSTLHRSGIELPKIEGSDLSIDEVEYINLMMNYWDKNIEYIWNRSTQELQRQIAHNIIELFRRKNQIKHFKVDSMRRYLRKMMNWDAGTNIYNVKGGGSKRNVFNRVIRFMRDRNKLLKFQYNKRGMIDFYYI
jgi:hypothetical protein